MRLPPLRHDLAHRARTALKYIGELPEHDINRMTHLNAMRHFSYDPFSVIPRNEATVKELRARQAGRDVAIRSTRRTPKAAHANKASDLGALTNN